MTLTLPWPPSVNTYWRNVNGRTLLSKAGRQYRINAQIAILAQINQTLPCPRTPLDARYAVTIAAHPPDRIRRDLDNMPKAILDALTHSGVIPDDSLIDDLRITRGEPEKPGRITLTIEVIA